MTGSSSLPHESIEFPHDSIESIIVASSRLIRVAARITGQTTSPAVWRTLAILRSEGPLRIGGLAAASRVSQPTMTKLLAGLVEQELVLRIADVDDSRAWLIALAPKGQAALDAYRHELGDALAPLFDGLSDADRTALERAAEILTERSAWHPDRDPDRRPASVDVGSEFAVAS